MRAPWCKQCHRLHWAYQPHNPAATSNAGPAASNIRYDQAESPPALSIAASNRQPSALLDAVADIVRASNKQGWARERYNMYMREYMRRRRAAKKEKE